MDISSSVPTFLRQEKLRAIAELVQYAQASWVTVALENVSESAVELVEVRRAAPGLGITLDIGHGQICAERNRSLEIIEKLGQSIVHVHIHDNDGIDDLHLPPGKGIIDLRNIVTKILRQGYDGTFTLEVGHEDLVSSRQHFQELIGGQTY